MARMTREELMLASDAKRARDKAAAGEALTREEQIALSDGARLESRLQAPVTMNSMRRRAAAGGGYPDDSGMEVGAEDLADAAARGMVERLDPPRPAGAGLRALSEAEPMVIPSQMEQAEDGAPQLPPGMRARPIGEATYMRRVPKGAGQYGFNKDLEPQRYELYTPMTLAEGVKKKFVKVYDPDAPQRAADRETAFHSRMARSNPAVQRIAGMQTDRERALQAEMDATRGERWGTRGSTTRASGRAQAITDSIRMQREAKAASDLRVREAQQTPVTVASGGVAMHVNPVTGEVYTAGAYDGRSGQKPMTDAAILSMVKTIQAMRTPSAANGFKVDEAGAQMLENMMRERGVDLERYKEGGQGGQTAEPAKKAAPKMTAEPLKNVTPELAKFLPSGTKYYGTDGKLRVRK